MKKIFYILASAIVALGAVACENDVMDNIATENEGLSFVATIDNSKTDLDGLKTIWSENDVITINGFEFAHQGEGKFTCTDSEVSTLKGQSNLIAWYNEDGIDSEAGTAGAQLKAEGAFDAEGNASDFSFAVQNAFLKFTTTETVTLKGAGMFSTGDEVTIEGTGETQYVAINPANTTLSYSVNGVKCKEVNLPFEAKKVYNLGELVAPYKWGFYGAHQEWDVENPDKMFKVAENVYAAKNVTLASNGFKFINIESIKYVEPNNPQYDLYLKPNSNWKSANARFAAYFFGNGDTWVSMTKIDADTWGVNKPTDKNYPSVIFCRMNPSSTTNGWTQNTQKWNQTADLTCPTDGTNCYTVKAGTWDKGGGSWSTYTVDNTPYWEYTDFGAWKDSANGYFNYSTEMSVGAWYEVADNNLGGQSYNIGVTDFTKTYDIYIKESVQTWGSLLNYTIVEHGTEVTFE